MTETSFASLGPRLLARKGGAKPAMRPQIAPLPDEITAAAASNSDALEDLGWNDMGAEHAADEIASSAAPAAQGSGKIVPISKKHTQQKQPKSSKPQGQARTKNKAKPAAKRAAFTLRLDTDRHLKLRIAATMAGVSAQSLVTQALDAMLDEIEELDTLVAHMTRN